VYWDSDAGAGSGDPAAGGSTTAGSTVDPAAQAAAAGSAAAASGGEDWEKRFKGLQPLYQSVKADFDAFKGTAETEKTQLMGKISILEGEIKTKDESIAKVQADLSASIKGQDELKGTVTTLEKKLSRQTLIMSQFPDLGSFEAKGLISPELEGDALLKALTDMRDLLGSNGRQALEQTLAGSTSVHEASNVGRTSGDDVKTLGQKLMEANIKGDAAEISRLTSLLVEAQRKEQATARSAS
jgi:hypothetical protein